MHKRFVIVLLTAAAFAFSTVAAHAAFDKDELKCRKGLAKGLLKAISTADKTSAGCHKSRHSGKEPALTDCNDLGSAPNAPSTADGKGKFAKSQQKLIDTPAKKCVGLDADLLDEFTSCPEPCETDLGLPNPLASLDQVAQCLACYAGVVVEDKNNSLLGSPDPLAMSGDDAKCAQAVAKGYGKYLSTILKTRTKCQDTIEKDGGMGLDSNCETSPDPDGKGKIAKALTKAEDGIDKACTTATLANVGACSDVDLASLKTCAQADSDAADAIGFPAHYELAGTICPVGFVSTILAGNGAGGSVSNSFLDVGWTGDGHNFDIPGDYQFQGDLSCPNGTPPCGTCTIDGVTQSGPLYERFLRCTNDFAVPCDEPFVADLDDCSGSICTYVLGPPLPLSAGGNPTCSVNALSADISGTTIVETGDTDLSLTLSTRVFIPGVVLQPCPVCVGDTTPNDGIKDGTCAGGSSNDGGPCDTQGFDETFASAANGEGLSLDCSPSGVDNISGSGLGIDLPLTTGSHSLGANNACDSPLGFLDCFCGQCSGNTDVACRDDNECITAGIGLCTAKGGNGTSRQPNGCGNFANCDDIGGGKGECNDDTLSFCDGITKANGGGYVTCNTNADCSITCGGIGGCGTCSKIEQRPCFLDPIVGSGVADPDNPTMVGNFCLSPTVSLSINGTTGTPGPGRVAISQEIDLVYP